MKRHHHYPITHHYPATPTDPEEITVHCACGQWEFFSQANINGGPETWGPDFEAHIDAEDYT